MDFDEFGDLDDRDARLEAEFRELEREAEVTRLKKRAAGGDPRRRGGPKADNPLKDMKDSLDGEDDAERVRYILVMCPQCKAKNRTALERVRTHLPRCGRCHVPLTFTR